MVDSKALRLATECVERKDWAGAAGWFRQACTDEEVASLGLQDQLRRNLALNFADLELHRPEVMAVLGRTGADGRFGIDVTGSGRPTITYAGKRIMPGDNPLASLAGVLDQLKEVRHKARPLAVLGTGDGYLLAALARHPVPQKLGMEQCVYFLEPNAANLLTAMMIHNYSGESGPIRQPRFRWYVGSSPGECIAGFRAEQLKELALPWPEVTVASQPSGAEVAGGFQVVLDEILQLDKGRADLIAKRADDITLERLIDATSERPSRKPRAVLLTTRFSTVLQYSTADMADGLRALGWEAEVVMEPSAHHALTYPLLRDAMVRVDPDVVFQLDHIRAEHEQLFPAQVPFVCWIQDNLPNLTNRAAGAAHGPLDFTMTGLGGWYHREFGYPTEAIIPSYKLTKPPVLPEAWESDGADLAYVSNASKLPEAAAAEFVQCFAGDEALCRVAKRSAEKLLALYEQGHCYGGASLLEGVVAESAAELSVDPALVPAKLSLELFERVNNVCYRQQALGWVAELAEERGRRLEIYGAGWDTHPRFAKYFKGYVKYGPELEALTRRTKINLQIVPYFCLHQRLLDGLAAGGFFLVRSHPADLALRELCTFVEQHLPPEVQTLSDALAVLSGPEREEMLRQQQLNSYLADRLDAVELARVYRAVGCFEGGAEMPARVGEVSFQTKFELAARIDRFVDNAELRREVSQAQRASVIGTLSYEAGMRRVIQALHGKLKALAAAESRKAAA